MQCAELLSDVVSDAGTGSTLDAALLHRADARLLLQLDRLQLGWVAVLQATALLVTGSCGQLGLLHQHDGPEVRLLAAHVASAAERRAEPTLSTLPGLCHPPAGRRAANRSAASLLLDYRCHLPDGALGAAYPPHLRRCLEACASSDPAATARLASVLGAHRGQLSSVARALLDRGLEEVLAPLGLRRPPCCVLRACPGARNGAPAARVSSPRVEPLPANADAAARLALHPRQLPLLELPGAASETGWISPTASREPSSIVAKEAALLLEDDLHGGGGGGSGQRAAGSGQRETKSGRLMADGHLLPASFDRRWTNPCWLSASDGRECGGSGVGGGGGSAAGCALSCLPYAHVLGVSKCGTTDLYARLSEHPLLLPSENKGPHFWDGPQTLHWYVSLFARGAARLQRQRQLEGDEGGMRRRGGGVFIDASSNTFTYSGIGVRSARSPPVLLPQVLAWLQPSLRMVLMLREPGERYFSAYSYYNRRYRIYDHYGPRGAQGFDAMVRAETGAFDACRARHSERRCARTLFSRCEQLIKGMYSVFLVEWSAAFPREQTLVLRLEDYRADLPRCLRAVLRFLRLPRPPTARWRRMVVQPPRNRGSDAAALLLFGSTRERLARFYAPFNQRLAWLMGDRRFTWDDAVPWRNASPVRIHSGAHD